MKCYLDVCVCPSVLCPLLEVEGVVLVGLVGAAPDQLVEDSRVILDTRAKQQQSEQQPMRGAMSWKKEE